MIGLAFSPFAATADVYYASPSGTGSGTASDPCSLADGISKINKKANTLILSPGRYTLAKAIALTGTSAEGTRTVMSGATDNPADVILDAHGESEAMRMNCNVFVSGVTFMNGSNGYEKFTLANRAAGVRIGYSDNAGFSVVSNCVITCCTNAFTDATKSGGTLLYGGAVCVFGNGLLVDSTVSDNTAAYRSAGVVVYDGEVRGCTISGNTAKSGGGGVFVERGRSAFVADSAITGNAGGNGAYGGGGAALYLSGSSLTLTNCVVSGNTARYGGGIDAWGGTTLKCVDCQFEGNEAGYAGGGVLTRGACNAEITGSIFDGNAATAKDKEYCFGGALGASNHVAGASLVVSNCVFRNNRSETRGGAIGGEWGSIASRPGSVYADIVDCVLTNNTSHRQGGAVCVRDQTTGETHFRMRNCLVAFNKTTGSVNNGDDGGGVYLVAYADPVLDSCTIVSNATTLATASGAGLYHRWGGTATNCIIAYNVVGDAMEEGGKWCYNASAYSHCCAWPALPDVFLSDNGCVNADPKFTDADAGDFTLRPGSPCRNKGVHEFWMEGAFDLAGRRRVAETSVDIGCYEFPRIGLALVFR